MHSYSIVYTGPLRESGMDKNMDRLPEKLPQNGFIVKAQARSHPGSHPGNKLK